MTSIGEDLATIRHHLKLTVEDIHQRTRIPLDILKRIENGTIFDDPAQNKVYLRSFVRTYGRSLNLDDELLLKALDQQEAGNYNRSLLDAFPTIDRDRAPQPVDPSQPDEIPSSRTPSPAKKDNQAGSSVKPGDETDESGEHGPEQSSQTADKSGREETRAVTGESADRRRESEQPTEDNNNDDTGHTGKAESPTDRPGSRSGVTSEPESGRRSVNWAELGHKFNSNPERNSAGWIIGGGLFLLVILVSLWFLFRSDVLSDMFQSDDLNAPEPPPVETTTPDGHELSLDLGDEVRLESTPETGPTGAAALDDVLYLTIYAAHERLEPVRVWADIKPRMDPYWMEQGQAFHFEFEDTIRVRTNYERMLLFLNGHLIENPRLEYFNASENAIELTRDLFEDDSRWANTVELELPEGVEPPDSISNRPIFD